MTTNTKHRQNPIARPHRPSVRHRLTVEALEGRELLSTAATSISIGDSNSALFFTQAETVTATITAPAGIAAPNGGTVTFFDNGNVLGTAAVSQGIASYTTSNLGLGSHSLTATYGGFTASDGTQYAASIATGLQSVVPASGLSSVAGVAADSAGDVFIADSIKDDVIEVTPAAHRRPSRRDSTGPAAWRSTPWATCSSPIPTMAALSRSPTRINRSWSRLA